MSSNKTTAKVAMPSEAELKELPEDERLKQADQASKAAASALSLVDSLKSKAALLTDSKQREKILSEAFDREMEAKGLTKKARILKSGTFQGAAGGAGIGAATGIGLGTVVGTVVGTVASVPTTALGGLVGAGTGAIHGPWIKLGGGGKKDGDVEEEKIVQVPQETIDSGAVQLDNETGKVSVKDSEAFEKAMSVDEPKEAKQDLGKKKPRKLEIRSNKQGTMKKIEPPTNSDAKPKRKPPKLEVRSKKVE